MYFLYTYLLLTIPVIIGFYLIGSNHKNSGFVTLLLAFIAAGIVRETPTTGFYQIGPKEYFVRDGLVVTKSEHREFRFMSPEGKKRSYATVRDTFLWRPKSSTFPAMKLVFEAKGTVELAQKYYAVYDSIRSEVSDSMNAEPMNYLGCGVFPINRYYDVLTKGLKLSPVVRVRSITYTYRDSLSTRDCQESDE